MRHFTLKFHWSFAEQLPPGPDGGTPPARVIEEDRTEISFSDLYRWNELANLLDHWTSQVAPVATRLIYASFQKLAAAAGAKVDRDRREAWETREMSDAELGKAPAAAPPKAAGSEPADDIRVVRITEADVPLPPNFHAISRKVEMRAEPANLEMEKSHA